MTASTLEPIRGTKLSYGSPTREIATSYTPPQQTPIDPFSGNGYSMVYSGLVPWNIPDVLSFTPDKGMYVGTFLLNEFETPTQKFTRLSSAWKEDTSFKSSISDLITHPAYLEIIGMGKQSLHFIFTDLIQNGPAFWFIALSAITGEDPVAADEQGNMRAMTEAWINWARRHFYVA